VKCRRRAIIGAVVLAVVAGISYTTWKRRKPHLPAQPEGYVTFDHPVLIINPNSGSGKAAKIGLADAAQKMGIKTIIRPKGEKLQKIAKRAVKDGCDHLIIAGGDGSLARVAKVAIKHDVAFSCVPSGTRNHFAMDMGLDRSDPIKALDAAFDGVEMTIDVGRIGKRVFLNNVSFGIYADAIADPGYRGHKTESLIDSTKETLEDPSARLSVQEPDGTIHDEIEVLLVSNNPYWFIGAPDFAGRASLDTGTLGVVLTDRVSAGHVDLAHSRVTQWSAPTLTVDSTGEKIHAGVDGSLRKHGAPVQLRIDHKALRVILPIDTVRQQIRESSEPTNEILAHLSGAST
jgi:diacylglycerol kinase family enzyme